MAQISAVYIYIKLFQETFQRNC